MLPMATLTLKDFPDDLLSRLQKMQPGDLDRSTLLKIAQQVHRAERLEESRSADVRSEAEAQASAWALLAGKWKSELPVETEIEEIYRARTSGREISL